MDPQNIENMETNVEKYVEKKPFAKTRYDIILEILLILTFSKSLFSGNKSVKKGSDCTQKFLSSLSHPNNPINDTQNKKKSFDNVSWSKELNSHKKMKLDHPISAEDKNIQEA